MATTAERIKLLRQKAGLTQTKLAELAGVRPSAVSMWEKEGSGGRTPEKESIRKLAHIFGVTDSDISGEPQTVILQSVYANPVLEIKKYLANTLKETFEHNFEPHVPRLNARMLEQNVTIPVSRLKFVGLVWQPTIHDRQLGTRRPDMVAFFQDDITGRTFQVIIDVMALAPENPLEEQESGLAPDDDAGQVNL